MTATVVHLCGRPKHQGEGTCAKQAGWGTSHLGEGPCKLHGGCLPNVAKAANLVLLEREARELFGKVVPEIGAVDNPLEAYAQFAGEVMEWKDLMRSLLDDLRDVGYDNEFAGQQIHAAVELYERSMDRANVVLSSYARLRIDDRLAEITEKQKLIVIRAIEAALDEVGIVDDEARQGARRRVARQLRLINGGAA